METVSYQGQTLRRWVVGNSTFLALPERGARLLNWNIRLGDGSVRDVVHWPEQADFTHIAAVRGGNPILFPFNARSFDQGEIYLWRDPAGVRRKMPMHGIARQGTFELARIDSRGFVATFLPDEAARDCYPFAYEFNVTYRFEPLGLTCELALTNRGGEPLPWSAGHHFYFAVPWSEGVKRGDYSIRVRSRKRFRQDARGLLVAVPPVAEEENLGNPELVDSIHAELTHHDVVFGERGKRGDVHVRWGTEKVPPPAATFVTWTLAEDSPYYCVEPWMGPPNAPENKLGLQWVAPGKTEKFTISVAVD